MLSGLNLEMDQGEFVSVIGRSGCGKTTLLRACAGFLLPSVGVVECGGRKVDGLNHHAGYVAQSTQLYEWMSVEANLEFPMRVRGVPRDTRRRRVESWIGTSGLAGFGDRYPSALSGGMQKRVAIGQTACFAPELLLLDEPFVGLDAFTKLSVQEELARSWSEYRPAALLVTHDISEAVGLSDRIIILTGRPARIAKIVHVDIPRPRNLEHLQTDERYLACLREIQDALGPEQVNRIAVRDQADSAPAAPAEQTIERIEHAAARGHGEVAADRVAAAAKGQSARADAGQRASRVRGLVMTNATRLLLFVAFLALWQLLTALGILDRALLSSPTSIAAELNRLFVDKAQTGLAGPTIYEHIRVTLTEWFFGFVTGSLIGIVSGIVLGRLKKTSAVLQPFFLATEGIPKIAIAPLFVLVFGFGLESKIAISALTALFVVFFQVFAAVRAISEERIRLTMLMGASRLETFLHVILPASARSIFIGLQVAVPMAMTGAIVGEFIASQSGLGFFINNAASTFDAAGVFAGILIIVVLVMLLSGVISIAQRLIIKWPSD